MKVRHLPENLLVNHVLGYAGVGKIAACAENAGGDGVDALVGEADVMRGDHDVVELQQRIVRGRGFLLEHVYAGAGDTAAGKRVEQGLLVDNGSAQY